MPTTLLPDELPLNDINVLDLSTIVMGPYGTRILADLGAQVIRVEGPQIDAIRTYLPLRSSQMSGQSLNLNRNKKSVVLDLKSDEGREMFKALVADADVLVHNMRPVAARKLGVDYDSVRQINDTIVYCSAYGFGEGGEYAGLPAYDDIIQAASGIASLAERVDGVPKYVPTVICDKICSQTLVYSICAALYKRTQTNKGCAIEVPMFETSIEFISVEHFGGAAFFPELSPYGFDRILNESRTPFKLKDGYACVLPYNDKHWGSFFHAFEMHETARDERFSASNLRVKNATVLYQLVAKRLERETVADVMAVCRKCDIPAMPVFDLDTLKHDPHVKQVGLITVQEHPTEGEYYAVSNPVTINGKRMPIRHHAPGRGEHTQDLAARHDAGVDLWE